MKRHDKKREFIDYASPNKYIGNPGAKTKQMVVVSANACEWINHLTVNI